MAMPNHVVLVRHGESEGNYVRDAFKKGKEGDLAYLLYQFREQPGPDWRLTEKGAEQAHVAGEWIQERIIKRYGLPGFDRYIYSPHRRTVETAGNLWLPGANWRHDHRLRERSWGELENLTGDEEHKQKYPDNYAWMLRDPLNWAPPGGISIIQMTETQVRSVFDTLHRDHDEKDINSVIASTHGEWKWAAKIALEYMSPQDWHMAKNDPDQRIHNCQVTHYTRLNPYEDNPEPAPYLRWVRSVCPWRDDSEGTWRTIGRTTFSNQEMIAYAETLPRLTEA